MPAFFIKLKNGFYKLTKDPAVFASVIIIWIFLIIFILFPLAKILILTFERKETISKHFGIACYWLPWLVFREQF